MGNTEKLQNTSKNTDTSVTSSCHSVLIAKLDCIPPINSLFAEYKITRKGSFSLFFNKQNRICLPPASHTYKRGNNF